MITRRRFVQMSGAGAALAAARPALAAVEASPAKRGCCFVARPNSPWRRNVDLLRPSWMYSWGAKRPEGLEDSIDFTPMLWGDGHADTRAKVLADLKARFESGEVRHVLGFNEPDQHNQSNLSVGRVVRLWPELMAVGAPLVSPGCVHPDREWMRSFMERVETRRLRVDAIAVHSYMGPSVDHLVKRLESVHAEFGRPLWITEFAVGDWQAKKAADNRHSPERVASFMREALPALDALDFVQRYAWFSASPTSGPLGTSALIDEAGELTPLGEIYAAH